MTLQNYELLRIPPNFWDILHGKMANGLFAANKMSFLYSGEESDASNCPCNRDKV